MDAVEFLTQQHLELASLFEQLESASPRAGKTKLRLCRKIGDLLAAHTKIEETILHRATKRGPTKKLLDDGLEAHVAMRRIVADLAELDDVDEHVEASMAALRERKRRHAEEEEKHLFPVARELLAPAWLEELGGRMAKMAEELMAEARRARTFRKSRSGPRALRRIAGP